LKTVVGLVTVLFVAGSAYAQQASHARLSPDDLKALTEARIAATKDILKLTPARFDAVANELSLSAGFGVHYHIIGNGPSGVGG
jgi:hypothetical protein